MALGRFDVCMEWKSSEHIGLHSIKTAEGGKNLTNYENVLRYHMFASVRCLNRIKELLNMMQDLISE